VVELLTHYLMFEGSSTATWSTERKKVAKFDFFGLSGFWTKAQNMRVKNDCTLSTDYYNINSLYYFILLLNY
jgi:hypothetical protein